MTGQHDLDRALGAWFGAAAAPAPPPEPLARILETTRAIRPRRSLVARVGSDWVAGDSTATLRPLAIIALLALVALALAGGAVLVGSRLVSPQKPPHTYLDELVSAPALSMPMAYPALVPLVDGRVLVIGDDGDGGGTGTRAILYDPATGVSESTGPLVSDESLAVVAAVRLGDGRVLVIGETVAQIFDPDTLQFAPVGPMVTPRSMAGVAALPDGRALIAGGYPSGQGAATSSAELFDPNTMTFSATGSMTSSRGNHSLAILPDGRVFVSPGESRTSVELYDPRTGTFSAAGTMSSGGYRDTIALPDGRVVVFGRLGLASSNRGIVEVWDPASLTFSPRRNLPGQVGSATLLDDGRILLLGDRLLGSRTGIYNSTTGDVTSMEFTEAWWPKATRLVDGRVLIVGGLTDGRIRPEGGGTLAPGVTTVEIFQ